MQIVKPFAALLLLMASVGILAVGCASTEASNTNSGALQAATTAPSIATPTPVGGTAMPGVPSATPGGTATQASIGALLADMRQFHYVLQNASPEYLMPSDMPSIAEQSRALMLGFAQMITQMSESQRQQAFTYMSGIMNESARLVTDFENRLNPSGTPSPAASPVGTPSPTPSGGFGTPAATGTATAAEFQKLDSQINDLGQKLMQMVGGTASATGATPTPGTAGVSTTPVSSEQIVDVLQGLQQSFDSWAANDSSLSDSERQTLANDMSRTLGDLVTVMESYAVQSYPKFSMAPTPTPVPSVAIATPTPSTAGVRGTPGVTSTPISVGTPTSTPAVVATATSTAVVVGTPTSTPVVARTPSPSPTSGVSGVAATRTPTSAVPRATATPTTGPGVVTVPATATPSPSGVRAATPTTGGGVPAAATPVPTP